MQTFFPYPSYIESLNCLDNKRLGKQRVEAKQILNCLNGVGSLTWRNHPAVKMWQGYEDYLVYYYNAALVMWEGRGYKNIKLKLLPTSLGAKHPPWIGNKEFHDSHKSNLLRKNYEWYKQFNWDVPTNLPYVWPAN